MPRWALRHIDRDVLIGEELVIGRSADCGLCIDDGASSRQHARVRVTDGRVTVEDLGSRNGTSVDGRVIGSVVQLAPGSRITIGATTLSLVELATGRARVTTPPAHAATTLAGVASPVRRTPSGTGISVADVALLDRAREALERGVLDECAGATAVVVRRQINIGPRAHADVVRDLSLILVELARRSGDRGWLDGLFHVHAAAGRLIDAELVDAIATLGTQGPVRALGEYVLKLRDRVPPLSDPERQLLARVEMLQA